MMPTKNKTGTCERTCESRMPLEAAQNLPYKTRRGELAEWLRSGLQIRRLESQKSPTIQQHNPDFPALANLRKSAEHAGNVRNAGRSLIGGAT